MSVDVARVRGLVPALGDGWARLDAPAGMACPERVATAVSSALRAPLAPPGGFSPASRRGSATVDAARRAIADLVGADPKGVVLGASVPALLERFADALADGWERGDEVVLSRLGDEDAIAPWRRAAARRGARVRTAELDIETCELPGWQYADLLSERTRAVVVTAACPRLGTRTEVAAIARAAHGVRRRGRGDAEAPLVVVDAAAAAAFLPLDVGTMDVDVLTLAVAAWGGPPVGALVVREPELLDRLPALEPADLPLALLAGVPASVDHLAGLDDTATGSRRDRLLASLGALQAHHEGLMAHLLAELRWSPGITVIGDPPRRIPSFALVVSGRTASEVAARLADHGVCVLTDPGDHGAFAALGLAEVGGVVRVGLAPYTSRAEVDLLVRALRRC